MSISTALKSVIKKVPHIKSFISERDELRSQIAAISQGSHWNRAYSSLNKNKLDLIDFTFQSYKAHSFADLGGVWCVNGGYTFYTLDIYNPDRAVLVDTHPTDIVIERSKKYPQLRFIRGNFGDKHIAEEVGQVDAIFLFDVLLHQVAPNWDELLEIYAQQTRCMVISNPQWIENGPTIRLLELGEDEYFENVPHNREERPYDNLFQKLNQKHPDHDRIWRDVHHIWQWGITDADLQEKIESLDFRMQYFKNCGRFEKLKNFENHAFVFSK